MYGISLDCILRDKELTREDLNRPIRVAHLSRVALRIRDWKSCAALLGISQDVIDDVDEEEKNMKSKRIKVFSIWKEWYGNDATYLMLANILVEMGRKDLIELLIKMYSSMPEERNWIESIPVIAEKMTKIAIFFEAFFFLLWKYLKLLIIMLVALAMIVASISPPHINDAVYNKPEKYSPPTDLAGLFWTNRTRCDSVSHDLPIISSPFVGREIEMGRIIQQMSLAHIININGAPGFGKSLLAIHIGYEMVRQGSTVRHIDAADKFLTSKVFNIESKSSTHSDKQEQMKQTTVNSKSLSHTLRAKSTIMVKILIKKEWMEESTDAVVKDLLTWSEKIQCPTVLILDNCDDLISHDMAREKN